MIIKEAFLTPGAEHGRTGLSLNPAGITIHYVGNPGSSAENNRAWFERGAEGAHTSAHYIIGLDGIILQLIPENERAQHAGKSYAPAYDVIAKTNNSRYIGIECCHPDVGGQFNTHTYAALIALCADICKRRNFIPARDVVRHYDITGKACPLFYQKNPAAWNQILTDIQNAMLPSPVEPDAGTVKVSLEGVIHRVKAENINGHWYITLSDLNNIQVRLSDILISAGYTLSWDAPNATVIAVKKV